MDVGQNLWGPLSQTSHDKLDLRHIVPQNHDTLQVISCDSCDQGVTLLRSPQLT